MCCLPRHVNRSCIDLFYSVSTILWWLVHITALCRTFLLLLFNNIPLCAFTVCKLRQMCIISSLRWLWIRLCVCNCIVCIYSNAVCVQLSGLMHFSSFSDVLTRGSDESHVILCLHIFKSYQFYFHSITPSHWWCIMVQLLPTNSNQHLFFFPLGHGGSGKNISLIN